MQVIKVIVDELPKDCADCVFSEWRHRKQWWECDCNAGTKPGIVLDPFVGSGTTCWVAMGSQ